MDAGGVFPQLETAENHEAVSKTFMKRFDTKHLISFQSPFGRPMDLGVNFKQHLEVTQTPRGYPEVTQTRPSTGRAAW